MIGKTSALMLDDFTVLDLNGNRKAGITLTEFVKTLYNPSGTEVSGSIPVTITDLGSGNYRASYTPNVKGTWKLVVTHPTYFPEGKEGTHQIYDEDIDSVSIDVQLLKQVETGRWKIDSSTKQMIFYEDDNVTEIMRFDLKDTSGSPSVDEVFERSRV